MIQSPFEFAVTAGVRPSGPTDPPPFMLMLLIGNWHTALTTRYVRVTLVFSAPFLRVRTRLCPPPCLAARTRIDQKTYWV